VRAAIALAKLRALLNWHAVTTLRGRRAALEARRRPPLLWASRTLGTSVEAPEARRLARRAFLESAARAELRWRPASVSEMAVDGLEHLAEARSAGRGAILLSAHLGDWFGLPLALAAHGERPHMVLKEPPGGFGRSREAQLAQIERDGGRLVLAGGSFPVLAALLERGELCWIAFDAKGSTPTTFLGRRTRLSQGTAALALATGAAIVPAFAVRAGARRIGVLHAPIDPGRFGSVGELHGHLAAVVEDALRADAEQAYPPAGALRRAR